jgi:hypothetical protein
MTQGNYQTIFEIGFRSFPWGKVAQLLIFVALGLVLVRFLKSKKSYLVVGVLMASMASIFVIVLLVVTVPEFIGLRSAYLSGKGSTVEGVVENFLPAPRIGPARESFSVSGVLFSYNALDDTPCFHNVPLHRGPVRDGLDVRIHYDKGCIQRVDVLLKPGSAQQ